MRTTPFRTRVRFPAAAALLSAVLACGAPVGPAAAGGAGARPTTPEAAGSAVDASRYETRREHDPEGTGRFYLGREIASVMGLGGAAWLERPERETEERPDEVIAALGLRGGETVADLGTGSGYFAFRIAPRVGPTGRVLAVDVSEGMLEIVRRRALATAVANVVPVRATDTDPGLAPGSVDVVLMVDVYHELYWPHEVMTAVNRALKPGGRLVLVEYRKEDPRVPIKEVHKMSERQIRREMAAVGLRHVRTIDRLPWQHIVVFER
jgi:SAM-dependent methyltransferase